MGSPVLSYVAFTNSICHTQFLQCSPSIAPGTCQQFNRLQRLTVIYYRN